MSNMIQEDKELLLKDLCARLPYMPKIKIIYQQQGIEGTDEGNMSCDFIEKIVNDLRNGIITDMQIYLRPMSSMTEEELKEFTSFASQSMHRFICDTTNTDHWYNNYEEEDWLNAHHFDYRGLIEKGLALEAPSDMYK